MSYFTARSKRYYRVDPSPYRRTLPVYCRYLHIPTAIVSRISDFGPTTVCSPTQRRLPLVVVTVSPGVPRQRDDGGRAAVIVISARTTRVAHATDSDNATTILLLPCSSYGEYWNIKGVRDVQLYSDSSSISSSCSSRFRWGDFTNANNSCAVCTTNGQAGERNREKNNAYTSMMVK